MDGAWPRVMRWYLSTKLRHKTIIIDRAKVVVEQKLPRVESERRDKTQHVNYCINCFRSEESLLGGQKTNDFPEHFPFQLRRLSFSLLSLFPVAPRSELKNLLRHETRRLRSSPTFHLELVRIHF